MKRHKMVNLCPTTYEIASKMPNFSKWIRSNLLNKRNLDDLEYYQGEYERMSKLVKDVADGKKRFVPGKGWIKNMYPRLEEE